MDDPRHLIGWASAALLVVTISMQVHKQWRAGTSEGVSSFLFVGQALASTGFSVYSIAVGDPVFVVTNLLLLVSALVGLGIVRVHRRRERRAGAG